VTEQLYGPNDVRTLNTREKHARILYRLGEFDSALSELTAVRAAMQAGDIHGTSLAAVLEDMAFVRNAQGAKDDELIALNEAALKEREADAESTTENLATGYNNLALAYYRADQLDRTLALFNKAHDLFAKAKGESYATATSLANIGGVQVRMGRWREGLSTQIEAREMFKRIGITEHQMLAQVLMGICDTEGQLESSEQAQAACDAAVSMNGRLLGESHPRFARALMLRASTEINALNFDAATRDLDRARAIYVGMQGNAAPALRAVDVATANMDRMRGDYAQLRRHLGASIAATKNPGASSALLLAWFALACERVPGEGCGNDDLARVRQALVDPKFAHNPDRLEVQNALAQIDLAHDDPNKAIEEIQQGLAATVTELGDRHSWVGEAHLLLGDARKALGDTAAANREYVAASAALSALPSGHPLRKQIENRLAQH
jgi:tetratricopeptide (TPR) repeat protein